MPLGLDDTIQLQSEALWERCRQRRVNANAALAAKVISATSHIHKHGHNQLRDGCTAFAYKVALFCVNLSHTSSRWLGASRLPRSEPRPLSPLLHFTLCVLSLCLITRRSMLTVNLLGGERDWEIKFILNSFPLMWQLPPSFPPLSLTSSLLSQQHSTESVPKHISLMFCTQKAFLSPPAESQNLTAKNGLPVSQLKVD